MEDPSKRQTSGFATMEHEPQRVIDDPLFWEEEEHFHLCSFEFLIVLDGEVEYFIGGKIARLKPGMFYFLEPGTTEFINRVIKKTTILAIRLPSIPNNKIFVKNKKK